MLSTFNYLIKYRTNNLAFLMPAPLMSGLNGCIDYRESYHWDINTFWFIIIITIIMHLSWISGPG